jgi:hypothetical protein
MTVLGQLIQPRLKVQWGFDLVAEEAVEGVSFDFQDSEVYPACTISFNNSPFGYKAYRRCIDEFKDEPIVISVGYPGGTWLTTQYFYTGATLGAGNNASIEVFGSAKSKEFLSSFYTGQFVEGKLTTLSDRLQEGAGVPEEAKEAVVFTESGKEIAENVELEGNITGTVGESFNRQLSAVGLAKDNTPLAQPEGKPVVAAPPGLTSQNGTDQPKEPPKSTDVLLRDETYGYIIGPGLIDSFSKTIRWGPGESENSNLTPLSGFVPAPPSVEGSDDPSPAPKGTRGKSPLETIAKENNPQLTISAKEAKERQDKAQCDGSFFMVPEMVGIKPRDVIFIPSMSLDYLEEWVLESVSYDFSSGGCTISVSGYRFDLGRTQKIVSSETYNRFLEKLKGLKTLEDWENYYWRKVNQGD